jgi:hypothetical protein
MVILPPVGERGCLMAKKPTEGPRKLVEFDAPTWHALNLLSRESMKSFQELADEARFRGTRTQFSRLRAVMVRRRRGKN